MIKHYEYNQLFFAFEWYVKEFLIPIIIFELKCTRERMARFRFEHLYLGNGKNNQDIIFIMKYYMQHREMEGCVLESRYILNE